MDKLNKKLSDFVSEQIKNKFLSTGLISNSDCLEKIEKYANFLKQPLKLEMFVPCDEYDNVLTKSTMSEDTCEDDCNHRKCVLEMNECIKYQQAKENVLFDGFFSTGDYITNGDLQVDEEFIEDKTVEDLIPYNLTLTKSAIDKHEL